MKKMQIAGVAGGMTALALILGACGDPAQMDDDGNVVAPDAAEAPAGAAPADMAQGEASQDVEITTTRGLDTPYTLIFPESMESVTPTDGALASIQHKEATLQCDIFLLDEVPGWNVDSAVANFDRAAQEEYWNNSGFTGFTINNVGTRQFQSGTALHYVGRSDDAPWGGPGWIEVAEMVDNGATYSFECISDAALDTDALVLFMMQNFSTDADGECCVD